MRDGRGLVGEAMSNPEQVEFDRTLVELQKRDAFRADVPGPWQHQRTPRGTLSRQRGIPELHLRHVYDQVPAECDALFAVRNLLENRDQSLLVLSGGVGTRKTGSACWALIERPGRFVTSSALYRLSVCRKDADQYKATRRAQVLVVDDLGCEYRDKGWFVGEINDIVNERYADCKKTIITTNLDGPAFKERYCDRVADRIWEAGKFVELGGESVRRK